VGSCGSCGSPKLKISPVNYDVPRVLDNVKYFGNFMQILVSKTILYTSTGSTSIDTDRLLRIGRNEAEHRDMRRLCLTSILYMCTMLYVFTRFFEGTAIYVCMEGSPRPPNSAAVVGSIPAPPTKHPAQAEGNRGPSSPPGTLAGSFLFEVTRYGISTQVPQPPPF
jgi:hypothetical protein